MARLRPSHSQIPTREREAQSDQSNWTNPINIFDRTIQLSLAMEITSIGFSANYLGSQNRFCWVANSLAGRGHDESDDNAEDHDDADSDDDNGGDDDNHNYDDDDDDDDDDHYNIIT